MANGSCMNDGHVRYSIVGTFFNSICHSLHLLPYVLKQKKLIMWEQPRNAPCLRVSTKLTWCRARPRQASVCSGFSVRSSSNFGQTSAKSSSVVIILRSIDAACLSFISANGNNFWFCLRNSSTALTLVTVCDPSENPAIHNPWKEWHIFSIFLHCK